MSIALMTEVWRLDMQPSDKMVLLALADAANDQGVTWVAVRHRKEGDERLDLLTKCSLSERAVQGALKRLVDAGHLTRKDVVGKGVIWTVHPRSKCAPQEMRPAGNDINPRSKCGETVSNHHTTPEANASVVGRASKGEKRRERFVPDGWSPNESHREKARQLGRDLEAEEQAFREHEFRDPKSDFDRAFHRWLRQAGSFGSPKATGPPLLTTPAVMSPDLIARRKALLDDPQTSAHR